MVNDCKYPECSKCEFPDCVKSEKEIKRMKETARKRSYRNKLRTSLPNCNECQYCQVVKTERANTYKRLCQKEMRLIEWKVTTSPEWCVQR